jgi:hypothetical protein
LPYRPAHRFPARQNPSGVHDAEVRLLVGHSEMVTGK